MIRPFTALTDATPFACRSSRSILHFSPFSSPLSANFSVGLSLGACLILAPAAGAAPTAAAPSAPSAPATSATTDSAPATVAAIKTAPSALRQQTRIRLAQLTQGTSNQPAAAPQQEPQRLEVPVGPDQPSPAGNAAPAPADPRAPGAPPTLGPPQTTPNVPPLIGDIADAEGREISDVRVVGNRIIPAETILAQVRTQRSAAFSSRQAELDRGNVAQLGFFSTVQAQISTDVEQPGKRVVTFIVQENRVVNAYRFVGASAIKEADIIPLLTTKIGVVLNRNNLDTDIAAIRKLYQSRGFAGDVQDFFLDETNTLIITLTEARISRIELSGLGKTRPSLVRRQIRAQSGDVFNAALIQRDLNRLYDLQFFDLFPDFRIADDPAVPGSLIVTYLFKEKRTGQLSFGVGFDSRSRITGFASVQENNYKGSGKRVGISAETGGRRNFEISAGNPFIGEKNASFDVSVYNRSIFRQPRLVNLLTGNGSPVLNPNGTISFNGNGNDSSNSTLFEEQRTGGRVNFTKPLDFNRNRTLLFGYRNESAQLFQRDNTNSNVIVPVTGNNGVRLNSSGRISAFSFGLLRDVRDIRFDASRGSRQQIIVEQGTRLLGDTTFTKLDVDFRFFAPLIRGAKVSDQAKLVLATRFVGGRALNQLPSFEQYFVGGTDTVRGFQFEQQFGDNQFYSNFELRYRLPNRIQLVGFVDAGSAFGGRFSTSDKINALYGYGVGVRLQIPALGLVRLDVAKGNQGDRGFVTHFGIGPSF